jgi:hypothetical protein
MNHSLARDVPQETSLTVFLIDWLPVALLIDCCRQSVSHLINWSYGLFLDSIYRSFFFSREFVMRSGHRTPGHASYINGKIVAIMMDSLWPNDD